MLLEYQLDWIKIVDFLLIAKFWASPNNLYSPSMNKPLLSIKHPVLAAQTKLRKNPAFLHMPLSSLTVVANSNPDKN